MRVPDLPPDEDERLAALRRLRLLDTLPEQRFDRLTRIAQRLFRVPIALISLIDSNRQWFKSKQGIAATETPRDLSFCGHAILKDEPMIVPDALADPRFADNPFVTGDPNIRFYAGRPIKTTEGYRVGTLCVVDSMPHNPNASDLRALDDLAQCVEEELKYSEMRASTLTLRESEARLHAILETLTEAVLTIDGNRVIHSFNPATERLFGLPEHRLRGHRIDMLIPDAPHFVAEIAPGTGRTIEAVGLRNSGEPFPLEISMAGVDMGGVPMTTLVLRDLTERRRIARLEKEFVATVSHELRTPLTAIRGALGLLKNQAESQLPGNMVSLLDIAHNNSERLALLINDILDMEKIESGNMPFEIEAHQLMPLIQEAVESMHAYAEPHGVEIRIVSDVADASVRADRHRFLQIMANLLSNAVKFSPAGGIVDVAVAPSGEMVRVSVHDRGAGIPEEFQPRLFHKFARADSSDTRKHRGTGLGLSITKALVERMDGTIDFKTGPGGTTFFFDLPAASEAFSTR